MFQSLLESFRSGVRTAFVGGVKDAQTETAATLATGIEEACLTLRRSARQAMLDGIRDAVAEIADSRGAVVDVPKLTSNGKPKAKPKRKYTRRTKVA